MSGEEKNPNWVVNMSCEQKTSDDYEESNSKYRLFSLTEKLVGKDLADSGGTGSQASKKPGWRNNPSATVATAAAANTRSMLEMSKSDTSISSNGPLKEFIRRQKPQICHRPTILFKLDPEVRCQAEKMAGMLAQKTIREPSLTSINEAVKPRVYWGETDRKKLPPAAAAAAAMAGGGGSKVPTIDPETGLVRGTSFQMIKVFAIDDEEDPSPDGAPPSSPNRQ